MGVFCVRVCAVAAEFPDQYPIAAPTVTFLTPIFHPNVSDKGELCNGLLLASTAPPASGAGAAGRAGVLPAPDDGLGKWSAAVVMADVFRALQKLLLCPVPEHPMNTTAADLFQSNHPEFIRMAAALRGASACAGAGSGSG
jgi:ubiquitin-protein ligase